MFTQNICISEKLKAQLDRSCTFPVSSLPSSLSSQDEKFVVNHNLRLSKSNLITDWESVLTLNTCMGEMNSESILRFQVQGLN